MNILLLVGTVLGVGALALGAVIALITAAPLRAALLGALAGGWAALYAAGVIVVSLTSHHELLPVGETKYFCGFYLDCHVGVAVGEGALHHLMGHLLAHRATHAQRALPHAQHLLLGFVGVGDESAVEPFRAAGNARDRRGDAARGARFRGRYDELAPLVDASQAARDVGDVVFRHYSCSPGLPRYQ